MLPLYFVTAVVTLLVSCSAGHTDNDYIFTAPRTIKIGADNQLRVQRFGLLNKGKLKVRLYYTKEYNGNETLAEERNYQLVQGKKDSYFRFHVDPLDSATFYNGRLQINGTLGDRKIDGTDSVDLTTSKNNFVIIQTDKPFYKPGQEVLFRILKLDNKLRPVELEKVAKVKVQDPDGNLLFQFLDVQLRLGIVQLSFPLANDPVKGSWSITVSNKDDTDPTSTNFDVKDYILPKFDVKINLPPFVLINAQFIDAQVCAQYTFGEPVQGTLNLNVSLETYFYDNKVPTVLKTFKLVDGCYTYTLNVSEIDRDNQYYRDIQFVANVVVDGTGVQVNKTQLLSRQYSPLNLAFSTDANHRNYFKPGLPYNGKVTVQNPDNTPAAGESVQICYTVTHSRILGGFSATKQVQFCRNFTSDTDGIIPYTIPPQNVDASAMSLDAKSNKYANDKVLNQPQAYNSLDPFFSPSGSFIQLAGTENPIPCGTKKSLTLLYTSKHNGNYKFYYEIVRQGKVVGSGTKEATFADGDDVSDKFNDKNRVIDGPGKTLDPPEDSSTTKGSNDCPAAKESDYVPPIGEVEFDVDVPLDLSPSFNFLVFYVRSDHETVADYQAIQVEKCFKNKVTFAFGDEVVQPGTSTSITITASPISYCGIKAVDKSVSLLDSSDQLTKDNIFQALENLDNNYYSGSNPCNGNTPQPGLSKDAVIIRPPGSFSYSYQDSFSSFQDAGFLVISNLILLTRPCRNNDAPSFPGGPIRFFKVGADVSDIAPGGNGGPGGGGISTQSAVDIRSDFRDTWLFELDIVGPRGSLAFTKTLPDTITEWVGSAVCLSSKDGIGLSNTTTIKGFQLFFISYTLPTSAIRGEEINAVVSIFNYADGALPITVTLDDSEQFSVVGDPIDGDICVQKHTSTNLNLVLKATDVGKVNITVRAQTADDSDVCGDSSVDDSFARDAVTQGINVEPEGFPAEEVNSVLICPSNNENKKYSQNFEFNPPEDVVKDSARAIVDISGNVLGPAIQNLNSLVSVPTGCGEQNLVTFVPNYLVLDYLTAIGKLTDSIKTEAIKNLNTGYQRELTYKRYDGSFSAFGNTDNEGSMFLTSFVLRSFYNAKRYITIDDDVLKQAQNFMVENQLQSGCFPDTGRVFITHLKDGAKDNQDQGPTTASVVTSLLISKYDNQTAIDLGFDCLDSFTDLTPYETFKYAYANALAGRVDKAKDLINGIKPFANTTGGVEYYNNPNGTESLDVETAAFAVIANLEVGGSAQDVLPIVQYLAKNQNSHGGFISTQDTVVGLQAIARYASLVSKDPVDLTVKLDGGLQLTLQVNEDNAQLVQRNSISPLPSNLDVEATGDGCGLLQTSLRYNTQTPPDSRNFNLKVTGVCPFEDCSQQKQILVAVGYVPENKKAGMSVVQIKMVTGNSPDRFSLDQLKSSDGNIQRVDVEDNTVVVYLKEVSNAGTKFSFDVDEVIHVNNPQPGTAKVFEYYDPANSATTSYSFAYSDATLDSDAAH